MTGRHIIIHQLQGIIPVTLFHPVYIHTECPILAIGTIEHLTTDTCIHHFQITAIDLTRPVSTKWLNMGQLQVIEQYI